MWRSACRPVARAGHQAADMLADAMVIHCTNFRGLPAARDLEAQSGVLVVDSIAASLWSGGWSATRRQDRRFFLG